MAAVDWRAKDSSKIYRNGAEGAGGLKEEVWMEKEEAMPHANMRPFASW
jgi:hypothetical protein